METISRFLMGMLYGWKFGMQPKEGRRVFDDGSMSSISLAAVWRDLIGLGGMFRRYEWMIFSYFYALVLNILLYRNREDVRRECLRIQAVGTVGAHDKA